MAAEGVVNKTKVSGQNPRLTGLAGKMGNRFYRDYILSIEYIPSLLTY